MNNLLSAGVVGFREGLEAFLIIAIMFQYLKKIGQTTLNRYVWFGVAGGTGASLIIGLILNMLNSTMESAEEFAEIWEVGASVVAVLLITTFIYWMIKHGNDMVANVKEAVSKNLSPIGIMLVAFVMIVREGVEISIFTFLGEYSITPISIGLLIALALTVAIYYSLAKVNLKVIFGVTLAYLILQAGFMLGICIHEGLSVLKESISLNDGNMIFIKAFNFKDTILDHKTGVLGIPLYVIFGWYSRPEWIQFFVQYTYTALMFLFWWKTSKKK